jgi:hypothetical protein
LASCQSNLSTFYETEHQDGNTVFTYSSDLRAVHVLKGPKGQSWILAEPQPDSAISTQSDFDLGLSVSLANFGGSDAGNDASQSASENTSLGGRTPTITLAREMLYRLNEMAYNTQLSAELYQKSFESIISTIGNVAIEEMKQSKFTHGYGDQLTNTATVGITESTADTDSQTATESIPKSDPSSSNSSNSEESSSGAGESENGNQQ